MGDASVPDINKETTMECLHQNQEVEEITAGDFSNSIVKDIIVCQNQECGMWQDVDAAPDDWNV